MRIHLGLGSLAVVLLSAMIACSSDDGGSNVSSGGNSSSSGGENSSSSSGENSSSGGNGSSGGSSSGDNTSGGTSSSGGVESLTATVTDLELQQDGDCTLNLTLPQVDTPSDAADAKIRAAIPVTVADYCEAGEQMEYDGGYEVLVNEWGILSIAVTQSVYYEGAAHPSHSIVGHNFDIATGDSLGLKTILNDAGLDSLRGECVAKLVDTGDYEPAYALEECNLSIDGFEGEGGGNIQIEKTGLRLYLGVNDPVLATDGALAPWSELADNVISPLVRNFVSKQ